MTRPIVENVTWEPCDLVAAYHQLVRIVFASATEEVAR